MPAGYLRKWVRFAVFVCRIPNDFGKKMGRYYSNKKSIVEDCRSVNVAFLKKHGYFSGDAYRSGTIRWSNSQGEETGSIGIAVSLAEGERYAQFTYTITDRYSGEKTPCDYHVRLTTTPCNLGGVRYWFVCPLSSNGVSCDRRVGTLYCPPGAKYYGCRHCYDLSYDSRNEPHWARYSGWERLMILNIKAGQLRRKVKRWTYGGKPTKKARRLRVLEAKVKACGEYLARGGLIG